MDFQKIIITSNERKIKVFRKINLDLIGLSGQYRIPDQVSIASNVEVQDPIVNGTSILYPNSYSFPKDLVHFIGEEIKLQLTDGSQITGIFVSFEDGKDNTPQVQPANAFAQPAAAAAAIAPPATPAAPLMGQRIVINSSQCHSEKLTKVLPPGLISIATSHIQSYFPIDLQPSSASTIIKFNDATSRDVIVSYDVKLLSDSFSSGFFRHIITGLDIKSLYSDPNLEANLPITFKTLFYWVPQWDIENENVTLSLVSDDNQETFHIKNFKCTKNYLTKITVNEFKSSVTRAVLVHPLGAIRISLYFQNNSELVLSNISSIEFGSEFSGNINNSREKSSVFAKSISSTLLNQVQPNKIGVISFNFENSMIKVYKDIAHQPLWDTKSRDFTIASIKISNIFILVETETRSKVDFQFVNATDYKTKYIVSLGKASQEQNGTISSNGKEIEKSLYLFDSFPLSISSFRIFHSQKKTFMTHHKLPEVLVNYLKEKGIPISFNKDKFETYDLSNLDTNTQNTIIKLMGSLYLEEKTSNYFNRAIDQFLPSTLFSDSNFYKSPASFYNNNTNVGLFGSSVGNFGSQQVTSAFGAQQQSQMSPFGAQQQPQQQFGFGAQQQPQQQFGFGSTSASTSPPATTSAFGFGSQPTAKTTPATAPTGFGFGSQSISTPSSFGFGSQPTATTATTTPAPATTATPATATTATPATASTTFGFGSQPTTTSSSFSFGSQTIATPAAAPIGFSLPTSTPSSFGFGSQPTATTTTAPTAFSFGSQTTSKNEESDSQNNSDTESISSFVSIPSTTTPPPPKP